MNIYEYFILRNKAKEDEFVRIYESIILPNRLKKTAQMLDS